MHQKIIRCLLFLFMLMASSLSFADWPNWRGPDGSGTTSVGQYPSQLDASNLKWKFPLPGKGCSTPAVFNQTIYITTPDSGFDALIALDQSGKKLWSVRFDKESPGKHRNGSGSNPSPAVDSSGIYVYYKSGTLACVSPDGLVRWTTNLVDRFGKDTLFWDHGTSPILTKDHVIMTRMHQGDSWIAAFEKSSGEIAWKTPRNYETPTECDHGYTTPLVISFNDRQSILTWGAEHVTVHDAEDGELLWSCGKFNPDRNKLWPAIATPVIVNDTAVICFGRNDRGLPQMHGVKISGSEDNLKDDHRWVRDDASSFVPSPISYQGKVYLVRDRGEVECLDPDTGQTVWSGQFPKSRSNFYATPLIAAGKLYAAREDGVVFVAEIKQQGMEVLSENRMQQSVISSPVPTNNSILIRGEKELQCFKR